MKVMIINTLYAPYKIGGAEVSVQVIAEHLASKGLEVAVVTLDDRYNLPHGAEDYDLLNLVRIYRLPIRNIYWPYSLKSSKSLVKKLFWHLIDIFNFSYKKDLDGVLKSFMPDIVYTNNLSGFSVYPWYYFSKKNIPILHTSRDYYLIDSSAKTVDVRNKFSNLAYKVKCSMSNYVDFYIPISSFIKDVHMRNNFFPNAKVDVVYNAVKLASLAELPFREKSMSLGFIGRISEDKGVDFLLDSVFSFSSRMKIYIAGSGEDEFVTHLKSKYANHDVTWLGQVDVSDVLEKVDFLVVPSVWAEPFGRVVIESYGYGVPVLVSDSGGLPEIVQNGRTGFVYTSGSKDAFIDSLQKAYNSDYDELRNNCIAYGGEFSVERTVDRIYGIINEYYND